MRNLKCVILFVAIEFLMTPILNAQEAEWTPLLDDELSRWDVFIGVPHHTVKG